MTVVTSSRAVDVLAAYAWVRHARLVRTRLRVAVDAGERCVIRRDQVTVRTYRAMMRNPEPGVLSCR
jgi:hypothetical protein